MGARPPKAAEEGLSYTPGHDPATVPSERDPQSNEVAAGFAASMEETDPGVRVLPGRIERSDQEIESHVRLVLRYNSETAHLRHVSPQVEGGVVSLHGTVPTKHDIAQVYAIVSSLEGVVRLVSNLEVAG